MPETLPIDEPLLVRTLPVRTLLVKTLLAKTTLVSTWSERSRA